MTTAPGGALAQLPRLLALVPYLLQHPGVQTAEAAALFGVTEDQLRRDLNLLWVCGLPGHGPGDLIDLEFEGDTITLFEPAGVTRPLRLTADEALGLLVALRTLADTPGLADRDAVDRALAKVEEAAGAAAAPAQRVEVALEGEEKVLPVVREALDRGRRLHLDYYVPGRDETTERDVDPMRLLLVDGRSYLEAWCRRVEAVRLFRLDRVVAISVLDLPAEPPPTATQRDISQGLFQPSESDVLVSLALGPGAHWVADYYPCESVEDAGDGTVIARLRTPDTRWVVRLALRLGPAARVVAPAELAAQVRSAAQDALAAYLP
jgi:proteasome accessory factor C